MLIFELIMKILFVETLISYDGPYLTLGLDCTKGKKLGPVILSIKCFLEKECFLSTEIDERELALIKSSRIDINGIFLSHKRLFKGWFDLKECNFMLESFPYQLSSLDKKKFSASLFL